MFFRRDGIKAATLDDVNRFATTFFLRSNRTVGTFIPTTDSKRAPPLGRVDVAAELKDYKGQTKLAAGETFDSSPENLDKRTEFSSVGPVRARTVEQEIPRRQGSGSHQHSLWRREESVRSGHGRLDGRLDAGAWHHQP